MRVTDIDNKTRRLRLSIKTHEIAEGKEAVRQYRSSAPSHRPASASKRSGKTLPIRGAFSVWVSMADQNLPPAIHTAHPVLGFCRKQLF